jgi:SAM-dependent methyltransferase
VIRDLVTTYWVDDNVLERQHIMEDVQRHYDWARIAHEWEQIFMTHFLERSSQHPKRIIQNMIYHSDLLAAKWVVQHEASTHTWFSHSEAWKALHAEVEGYIAHHHEEPEQYAVSCGDGVENIYTCPDRMKIALELIEQKYGHDQPFTFLDIGCGAGRMLYHVVRNFHNAQVMGFDFSEELCAQAYRNIVETYPSIADRGMFIQCADILKSPPPDDHEKADVVWAGEWLEHQTEIVQALQRVHAWCKEGGMVIYTTPYGPWEAISFGSLYTTTGHEIRFHVSHFEHHDLMEMFREVGPRIQAAYIQRSPLDMSVIGNFVTSYEKPMHAVHFYEPDYARKFLTTRPYVRVGALLIVKDEEDNILRALKPLAKRMDALVVYDTGSQDKTIELATPLATEVVQGYWDDDFGAARNRALDVLKTYDVDLIYWQDADEECLGLGRLKFYFQGDLQPYEGAIILQNQLSLDTPLTRDLPTRVFRNREHYGFFGCLHEQVLDLTDPTGNTDLFPVIILPDIPIAHYGYLTEMERRQKAKGRNFALLEKDRQVHPEREWGTILLMRDFIHIVIWENIEKNIPLGAREIDLLHRIIVDAQDFDDPRQGPKYILAQHFCQQALAFLGNAHLPSPYGEIPLQAVYVLDACRGSLPSSEWKPQPRWFVSVEALQHFIVAETEKMTAWLTRERHIFDDGIPHS